MSKFTQAVIISTGQVEINRPPPGLGFLAGICDNNSLPYQAFDLNAFVLDQVGNDHWIELYHYTSLHDKEDDELSKQIDDVLDLFVVDIKKINPDIIMITVLTHWQKFWCKKLLEKIKTSNINAVTVAGGPGISVYHTPNSTFGKYLCDHNLLDYYVLGEGDVVLDNFLKGHVELGMNSKADKVESWAIQIDDLDANPLPSYKKINVEYYKSYQSSGVISLTGSRGCVRRCTFCDVGNIWKKFRFRSAGNIVKEIEKHYLETGYTNFAFTDSLINGSLKNFTEFMQELIKLQDTHPDLKNITYTGQFIIRPQAQHPEYMFELMKQSGYRNIAIGIETGSDTVRFHMKKKFTNADIDYHLEMCERYKLGNTFLFMTGYPTETLQDFNDSLNMVRKYQKYLLSGTLIDVGEALPLTLLKNTPLHLMSDELGIDTNDEYYNIYWVSKENPELTVKERWRRYIAFQRELILLGYPRPGDLEVMLTQHFKNIKNFKDLNYVSRSSK